MTDGYRYVISANEHVTHSYMTVQNHNVATQKQVFYMHLGYCALLLEFLSPFVHIRVNTGFNQSNNLDVLIQLSKRYPQTKTYETIAAWSPLV